MVFKKLFQYGTKHKPTNYRDQFNSIRYGRLISSIASICNLYFPLFCRFYLVSDGIPLIIVGVTAAFGMDNYGSRDEAL